MKKTMMSIALAAMAAFALTACSGNSDNNGSEATDTTNVEQTTETDDGEAKPAEEIPVKELKELECDAYHLNIPEGWRANSRMVNSSCNIGLPESPFSTAALNVSYNSLDEFKQKCEKIAGVTKLDDVTVGDKTFVLYYYEKDGEQFLDAATAYGEKTLTVRSFNGANKMDKAEAKDALIAGVKKVLENVTIK